MIDRAYVSFVVAPEGPKRFMAFETEAEAQECVCTCAGRYTKTKKLQGDKDLAQIRALVSPPQESDKAYWPAIPRGQGTDSMP